MDRIRRARAGDHQMILGLSWMKLGIGFAVLVAIGLFAWAIKSGIDKIEKQGKEIATLKIDLAAEKAARERDVKGLTVLSQGIVDASAARALDERALGETINEGNSTPVSPELAALLGRLRLPAGANPGTAAPTTGRAGEAARSRTGVGAVQR